MLQSERAGKSASKTPSSALLHRALLQIQSRLLTSSFNGNELRVGDLMLNVCFDGRGNACFHLVSVDDGSCSLFGIHSEPS